MKGFRFPLSELLRWGKIKNIVVGDRKHTNISES